MSLVYLVVALFAILISAFLYHRTQPELSRGRSILLSALRAVTLAIALLLLLAPIWYYLFQKTDKAQIIVLTDISASMDLEGKSALLKPLEARLSAAFDSSGYELHRYNFAQGLEADKSNTLLAPALAELAKKHDFNRVKGIVLASDGWLRDESLSQAKQIGTPFYVVADTAGAKTADLGIVSLRTNRHAYRNEPTLIQAELKAENYGGKANVDLLLSGRKVATQTVELSPGTQTSVEFSHRFAQTGFYPFRVELSAPGVVERLQNNNSYPGAIEVLSDKQRVVVISDKPAWDNKFVVDSITENNRWELAHYLVQGERILQGEQQVSSIPATNLAAIVLINNGGLRLSGSALSFVLQSQQQGVGIMYQGLPLDELKAILPLQKSNVLTSYQGFLQLSPAATGYPLLSIESSELQNIPPLDYYYVTATPGSEVLATMNNPQSSPAIAVRNTGGGKVIAMAFLNLWKWQLQSASGDYRKLLSSSITWLANTSESGYSAINNNSYFLGEEITLRLRAEDDIRALRLDLDPQLKVFDASGKELLSDFMLQSGGEYRLAFKLDQAGQYRFEIRDKISGESTSGRFNVADSSIETRDYGFNLPLLTWLANDTQGKLLTAQNLDSFKPLPAQANIKTLRGEIPFYRKWYVLALFILTFCLELFFRRRWGLL